jgi:hypothetical protein
VPPTYDFALKEGDTHSTWEYTLEDRDGDAIDVSGANDVRLTVVAPDGTKALDAVSATIADGANGVVSHTFADADLTQAGGHDAEWEIEHAASDIEYIPYDDYLTVFVEDTL